MKKIKRWFCIPLCLVLIMLMVSCDSSNSDSATSAVADTDTTTSTDSGSSDSAELSEEEAWKLEPAYGTTIKYYYDSGNCTSAPYIADVMGYFEEAGLSVEGFMGNSVVEALGTNSAQLAVHHVSTLLVPATNGVDLTFVAGSIIGCKTLYVLGDSEYETTEDLKGLNISAPNGIGGSDYNILVRFFDKDGIDPLSEVNIVQVETDACVAAMQSGEIAGALLSDVYAYDMVKEGLLKPVRSLLDEDFTNEPCCVVAMNSTFVKENPITAKKVTQCVKAVSEWMRNNPEEAVQLLLDDNKMSGDFDMNVELWNTLQFGLTDEFTENGVSGIVEDYIKLGLITAYDDTDEVMELIWSPMATEIE